MSPWLSPWFVSFMSYAQTVSSYSFFPRLSNFVCFLRASYVFVGEKNAFRLHNLEKRIQSICALLVEKVFVSELNVLLLRRRKTHWGGKQTDCLPCAGAAADAGQNEFFSENRHPSDETERTALENESLNDERFDNIEQARV